MFLVVGLILLFCAFIADGVSQQKKEESQPAPVICMLDLRQLHAAIERTRDGEQATRLIAVYNDLARQGNCITYLGPSH